MKSLIINSSSSGKYHYERIGNRQFLITKLLAMQADDVMNGLYYSDEIKTSVAGQLNNKPAPLSHPSVNGEPISASHPALGASFSFGAHVRNPTVIGNDLVAELAIDVEVANRSDEGKEVVQRILNGERIGVSLGGQGSVIEKSGTTKSGKDYFGMVKKYVIDHLAILLREPPAGENTYTLNSKEFFNPKKEVKTMREITIDTEALSLEDHKFLQNCDADSLVKAMKRDFSEKEAQTVLVNAGKQVVSVREYEEFVSNSAAFAEFQEAKKVERNEKIEFVVNNSAMQEAHVSDMSDDALESLVNSIKPKNKHIVNGKVEEPKFIPLEDA